MTRADDIERVPEIRWYQDHGVALRHSGAVDFRPVAVNDGSAASYRFGMCGEGKGKKQEGESVAHGVILSVAGRSIYRVIFSWFAH